MHLPFHRTRVAGAGEALHVLGGVQALLVVAAVKVGAWAGQRAHEEGCGGSAQAAVGAAGPRACRAPSGPPHAPHGALPLPVASRSKKASSGEKVPRTHSITSPRRSLRPGRGGGGAAGGRGRLGWLGARRGPQLVQQSGAGKPDEVRTTKPASQPSRAEAGTTAGAPLAPDGQEVGGARGGQVSSIRGRQQREAPLRQLLRQPLVCGRRAGRGQGGVGAWAGPESARACACYPRR